MSTKLSKALIGAAAVALTLPACTSDDVILNDAKAKNEIAFSVTTNAAGRALAYTDADQITNFKVAAWYHKDATKGTYFNPEVLSKSSGAWTYNDNNVRYWPNNGEKLDFYAWVDYANVANKAPKATSKGYTLTFDDNGAATLAGSDGNNITILDSNDAVDLLYASAFDQAHDNTATANKTSTKVSLNFKHACAQVGVTAKVDNPNIHMEVKEVALVNIISGGKFNFPTPTAGTASWTTSANDNNGTVAYSQAEDATWTLSSTATNFNESNNRFIVLPQTVTDSNSNTTPCIRLACKVWNVTDGATYDSEKDLQIYGDASFKYLYIPVNFVWEMGKNYTYNLTFGKGNAGLDTENKPTLVLVDWTVDFTNWESTDPTAIDK